MTWSGSRREFGGLTLGGIAAALASTRLLAIDSTIGGVKVGAISYCFRSIPRPAAGDYMDTLIDAFKQVNLGICELESVRSRAEPAIAGGGRMPATITPEYTKRREELRQWRLSVPMDRFKEIKTKFNAAGIDLMGYVMTFSEDFTDEEIDRTFLAAKTLGVKIIGTNQTRVPMGKRLAPFADKYDMTLGWHNHAMTAGPERGRVGRELQEPVLDVEALQGQSRCRPLRRGEQRPDRLHEGIREGSDHARPPEGPQAEQRCEPAVGPGRNTGR